MIIVKIWGGLGNQLFNYACGLRLAHKHNTELKLDITDCIADGTKQDGQQYRSYYRLADFNIHENFASEEEIKSLQTVKEVPVNGVPGVFMPKTLDLPDNVRLEGLWQSEKYFSDIPDIIRNEISLKNPLGETSSKWLKKILTADCAVSLHIRHGGYLSPIFRRSAGILPMDYYKTSVERLKKDFPQITLFVFSDDLDWAKKNLNFGVPIEFVEGCERDAEEIYLMSQCKHNIVSQGTFAWWGAWLNQNPDKKVFAPNPWQRGGWGGDTIVPPNWIKIPVNYNENPHIEFPPLLSIIIYAEENANADFTIQSALLQQYMEYEIVIIDAGVRNESLRRFVQYPNVTYVKANRAIGKFAAWNLGAELARGEYCSFLTGKDFIISGATILLSQTWHSYYMSNFINSSKERIQVSNYNMFSPNVVCSIQRLEENNAGQFNVNGISDKRFTALVDAAFQNLNAITEINIDSAQKLILLATNQLNNLIGTKFFKRSFLVENKIRFDEKIGDRAELTFLVDAFMRTEKIVLVPQIFYGRLN